LYNFFLVILFIDFGYLISIKMKIAYI